jgi:hypothetical protein
MIITLYIFLSYLVMVGIFIESYEHIDDLTWKHYVSLMFSPIVLPILIGMMIAKK